jgi:methylated-DNA-[protein]-cysteine S-methyltransferase
MTSTHTVIDSPIGPLTLVAAGGALSGVYNPGHWTRPNRASWGSPDRDGFGVAERQLTEYLAGERTAFDLPTTLAGDGFQRRVWALLAEIPYGETTTYGELARRLGGDATLARAVGRAVAHNPLSIIIPCHRVLGHDGALTGYAGGLDRKRFLLDLEGALPAREQPVASLF